MASACWVDGLRIDHPDGLHDPGQYLQRLRQAAPGAWITVEKILEPGEHLPAGWPVAGTTGYDFLNRVTGLFVDTTGEKPLTEFYNEFTGEPSNYAAIVREKKRLALQQLLPAEINRLVRLLEPLVANEPRLNKWVEAELREALVELTADLPVYRTYVQAGAGSVSDVDLHHINVGIELARKHRPELGELFDFLRDVLVLKIKAEMSAGIRDALPAAHRTGDGEGRRGYDLLLFQPAGRTQRGRRQSRAIWLERGGVSSGFQ